MGVLYINNSYCTTLAQLKDFFSSVKDNNDDIYYDLLSYGRDQYLSRWFRENGESDLASKLEVINPTLGDSDYFKEMSQIILQKDVQTPTKPAFLQCCSLENVQHECEDSGLKVLISVIVLQCVNENYELKIETEWGTRIEIINPFNTSIGETLNYEFCFRKRPNLQLTNITIFVDSAEYTKINIAGASELEQRIEDKKERFKDLNKILEYGNVEDLLDYMRYSKAPSGLIEILAYMRRIGSLNEDDDNGQ